MRERLRVWFRWLRAWKPWTPRWAFVFASAPYERYEVFFGSKSEVMSWAQQASLHGVILVDDYSVDTPLAKKTVPVHGRFFVARILAWGTQER